MENYKKNRIYTPKKINIWRSLGFGIGDFVGGGGQTIIGAWMLFFYTTYCNMTAVQGALILSIARIVDAIVSLMMGTVTDNFYRFKLGRKFGRRHFFILISAPLLLVFFTAIWISGMSFWYYLTIYIAFDIVSTCKAIAWETLPTEMTSNYDQRTLLSTTRMFISASATFLATFLPAQLFRILGTKTALPFFINGLTFGIIFFIAMLIIFFSTWERPVTKDMALELEKNRAQEGGAWIHFKAILKEYMSTLKIKSFRKHLYIYLLSFTGKDTFNIVFAYFIIYCLGSTAATAANLLSLSIIGLAVTLLAGWLMVKFGPRFLYISSYSLMILMFLAYYLMFKMHPSNMILMLYIISIIYQIGRATLEFVPWNVFPFIPDLDELVTKQSRAGVFAATMNFVRKSTVAVATLVVGFVLDSNGFAKNAVHQSLHTQNTIAAVLVIGAGGLIFLALLVALTFKLNKKTHQVVLDEITRLRNGGRKDDVNPEVQKICEVLTGIKYADMWKDIDKQ
ncbi:MAG: MFS transporter [Liquorilactobacillus ghanensis]|uniref:MFS transporter n=1 Tax=Liquorilactobacillus TaxID=2767888 RepID=UPI0039EA2E6A